MENEQKDAYLEGIRAFDSDLTDTSCPYTDKDCLLRAAWFEGYENALEEHTDIVTRHQLKNFSVVITFRNRYSQS